MGGTCGMAILEMHTQFCFKHLKGRYILVSICVVERILLKWFSDIWVVKILSALSCIKL
jgi:hypothetical protein